MSSFLKELAERKGAKNKATSGVSPRMRSRVNRAAEFHRTVAEDRERIRKTKDPDKKKRLQHALNQRIKFHGPRRNPEFFQ